MHLSLMELLLIFVGGVLILGIQFYLSTRKNRFMGLLFPIVSFGYSIYMFLKSDFFSDMTFSIGEKTIINFSRFYYYFYYTCWMQFLRIK